MRINKHTELLKELIAAQKSGFITKLELVLEESFGIIDYDDRTSTFSTKFTAQISNSDLEAELELVEQTQIENVPDCRTISVVFADAVSTEQIHKISSHVCKKYGCKTILHPKEPKTLNVVGY